jgi:uncharacterized protein (DUF3084 family)
MSDDNEFAARLDAVERDVAAARSDAAAARSDAAAARSDAAAARMDAAAARELASGAYEDLSRVQLALNAHFRVLNALRETQLDHGRRLDSLEGRFDRLEGRFDRLESEMREGFSVLNLGMVQITAMLTTLIGDAGQNGPASPG